MTQGVGVNNMTITESIKAFFKSKTMRFQIICALLIMAESNLGLIETYLGSSYGIVTFVVIGINVYLRTITTEALHSKNV